MLNKNLKFNYYSGNIKNTIPLGIVTLEQFIDAHENPTDDTISILNLVSKASGQEKRKLKHKLYAFTPSVIIKSRGVRCYNDVACWTGLMQLDFDKLKSEDDAKELKYDLFDTYPFIVCSYLSPSKKGVKCLIRITIPKNKEHYKAIHKAIRTEFKDYKTFDNATNNAVLPLFLSQDTNILFQEYDKCDIYNTEDWSVTEYVSLNNHKSTFVKSNDDHYYNKTIRIFSDKINYIIGEGHSQVRSACLILGSRCGAGYIDQFECHSLAEDLIKSNNYLTKGTSGYISTSKWAINQGILNPKYY